MLPLPQCPLCGNSFSSLAEAFVHLDLEHPHAYRGQILEPESQDSPTQPEADDPIGRSVEEAG